MFRIAMSIVRLVAAVFVLTLGAGLFHEKPLRADEFNNCVSYTYYLCLNEHAANENYKCEEVGEDCMTCRRRSGYICFGPMGQSDEGWKEWEDN